MREVFRARRLCLRTARQKQVPPDFARRMILAAHVTNPLHHSRAMIGHDPNCPFVRGGTCSCVPDITLSLPGGELVTVDPTGRVQKVLIN
ncbi:MAG TPA: hypothetical protein VIH87_07180 [Methylocella sp.]